MPKTSRCPPVRLPVNVYRRIPRENCGNACGCSWGNSLTTGSDFRQPLGSRHVLWFGRGSRALTRPEPPATRLLVSIRSLTRIRHSLGDRRRQCCGNLRIRIGDLAGQCAHGCGRPKSDKRHHQRILDQVLGFLVSQEKAQLVEKTGKSCLHWVSLSVLRYGEAVYS